jgi:hypothetical protein
MFLPLIVNGKEPTIDEGIKLVKNYINDFCGDDFDKGIAFQKYLHPDFMAIGNDNFDYLVIERKFIVTEAKIIKANINSNHPKMEKILKVAVQFQKLGYFDYEEGFVKEKGPFPFAFYLSKSTGRYLILDSDDNERVICFYDSALKSIEDPATHWKNPQRLIKKLKAAKQ